MTTTELKQILQEIKGDCQERKVCQGCKFCLYEGCALSHIPDEWNLDKIGLAESEDKEC